MMLNTAILSMVHAMLPRAFVLTLIWLALNGSDLKSWVIGLPFIIFASWVSLKLVPPSIYKINLFGFSKFFHYFLIESVRGGWDVAKRTLSPTLNISPGNIQYTSSLPTGLPIVLFSGCISLLPGSLTQQFEGKQLSIHLLDANTSHNQALLDLENLIANMLGLDLEAGHE